MDALDPWRHLEVDALEAEIWHDVPEHAKRWTVAIPYIASTTDTVVAFLSGKRPQITVAPKAPNSLTSQNRANANERLGAALFDTLDRDRSTSLLAESAEYDVHRGHLVGKILYLSPEERGEDRAEVEPQIDPEALFLEDPVPEEVVVGDQRFPLFVQLLDPRDCAWNLGRDNRVIEFVHEYTAPFSLLCDQWPDLAEMNGFDHYRRADSYDNLVTVIDYWNEDINAILVDQQFYKRPTPHLYPRIPFVVELVHVRKVRDNGRNTTEYEGVPFCSPMLNAIRQASRADSISASYLEEAAFSTVVHEGIDPEKSPYWQRDKDGTYDYIAQIDHSTGARLVPAFNNERFRYMEPPPIVPTLQEFKQARQRDLSLVSFPESILSGAQVADVSGYAYSQMKQAAIARIEPYRIALDRFWSRMLLLANDLIAHFWDYLSSDTIFLSAIGAEGSEELVEVSQADFQAIGGIRVVIKPEVPINQEAEWGLIFQMYSMGLISAQTAMDQIGLVQDPDAELKRVAFEMMQKMDPSVNAAVAMQYMQENGITPAQPAPPPTPPASPAAPMLPPGMGGMAPGGASGPAADPTQAPPAAPGAMPMGGLPPELAALLGGQ